MGIFNIIIIVYNFINTLINSFNGNVSYISIGILAFNLYMTITALKQNKKNVAEIICLIFEILTGLIILLTII